MKSWTARFVIDHGRVTEQGELLRTFERRRMDEPYADLHVIAEPSGNKGQELGAQAVEAIGRLFEQDRLSLTGGLQRALRGIHQTLLDWNRRSLPGDQVTVGVIAALVSGNLIYLSQVGPGVVYSRRAGSVVRLDAPSESFGGLGEGDVEPAMRRLELQAGDLVLAATPGLDSVAGSSFMQSLLTRPTDEALPELYRLTRGLHSFALYAITALDDNEPAPFQEADPRREPGRPADGGRSGPALASAGPGVAASRGSVTSPAAKAGAEATIRRPQAAGTMVQATVMAAEVEPPGPRSAYAGRVPRRFYPNPDHMRLLQGGAALAAVLLLAYFVPGLLREGRSQRLSELLASSHERLAQASSESDPARRRALLGETRELAAGALRRDPASDEAANLLRQASASLEAMDAVVNLGPVNPLVSLDRTVLGEVAIGAVAVGAGNAYLLDEKGGRVLAVSLGAPGLPVVALQEGHTYGGVQAASPAHIAWEGPPDTGRLLVLDNERRLFEVRPGAPPQPVPLRRTDTWRSAAAIATYDGNLYVLDPAASQVHRYLPAAIGFDSEPSLALAGQTGLQKAEGLAVRSDIFVLLPQEVRRFHSGTGADFSLGGIDATVERAAGIAALPGADEVYIADAGKSRIVVASGSGVFKRQLISAAFIDLRAITTDASNSLLYVVAGNSLLAVRIDEQP